MEKKTNRREFLATTGTAMAGTLMAPSISAFGRAPKAKKRIALVGTGVRGISMWGKSVAEAYKDNVEFVGLCDSNPGRLEFGKKFIGVNCKTYTNFEQMMSEQKPESLIVTTMDSNHHEFIIKGMEMGADIITEKPMTTDERKVQAILDTERSTGKNVIVTFNYRYSPHRQKMYELLHQGAIGDVTSVDFHWYLDTDHGASYFRRWHGEREHSGTLLVHKSTHHFDLLNWWLESEPEEVFAYGKLEHYGLNNEFRGPKCRTCDHKDECNFYWDITKSEHLMNLYVKNEEYDGYIRDNCIFRKDINIYDKMAASIRYANDVQVSYSLTTYSPYEGYRIAFNGTDGRLEAWIQESQPWEMQDYDELRLTKNFGETELIKIPHAGGGHGGGDARLKDKIFKNPDMEDPYRQSAGSRDGAMSVLLGVAARNSVESGEPVKIATLTDLKPRATRL
ncbi:Gfo/Idh/MocA family protein [Catalinimonas niigatensis]|uniref:Gfo/Idh/MocA family protein n=1 Tax=Catalinimonas niigatensis TaxID=1397264 RepID=UPI0026671C8E|nr:Gfo/Idh/MocA family oxidoreductase [Catalinimonas niigatensis]WPP51558.1 Gfo/Idh/MocA family oxidoreductase [Catalinimonas niigatensis]